MNKPLEELPDEKPWTDVSQLFVIDPEKETLTYIGKESICVRVTCGDNLEDVLTAELSIKIANLKPVSEKVKEFLERINSIAERENAQGNLNGNMNLIEYHSRDALALLNKENHE